MFKEKNMDLSTPWHFQNSGSRFWFASMWMGHGIPWGTISRSRSPCCCIPHQSTTKSTSHLSQFTFPIGGTRVPHVRRPERHVAPWDDDDHLHHLASGHGAPGVALRWGGDPDHHRGGVRRVRDWRVPVVGGYPIAGWLISNRNSHRSKWMMTGGSPVTKPKPPYDRRWELPCSLTMAHITATEKKKSEVENGRKRKARVKAIATTEDEFSNLDPSKSC